MNQTLAKKQNDYIYADGRKKPNPAAVGTLILAAKAAGDAGSVEQHKLSEQIEADRYLASILNFYILGSSDQIKPFVNTY